MLSAVHFAEVVAHRVGEPFGSLVLAVAVTVIEVGLIVTLMVSDSKGNETLARDTVFAAAMITVNGILGLSVLIGALRDHVASFNAEGTATALATVSTLAVLTLVLPKFTTSHPGAEFTSAQLAFAAVASVCLYGLFVFVQTVRHRDYFVGDDEEHAAPPSDREALISLALLVVALVAVVGLAKVESKAIEDVVTGLGAPKSAVGVVIALLVLGPETLAAVRNARRGRVQTSLNLALGSAIASIGLTIPAIAVASIWLDGPAGARARLDADRPARDHHRGRRVDRAAGARHRAGGRRPSGAVRRVRLPGREPVACLSCPVCPDPAVAASSAACAPRWRGASTSRRGWCARCS